MNKISILIVDDSEADRYLLKRDLSLLELQIEVFEKENGETSLEFFKNYEINRSLYPDDFPPMIVFLDVNMPGMGGYEFLEKFAELRQEIDIKTSVFMMFTSTEQDNDRTKALSFSFVTDYLIKGQYDQMQLKEKILSIASGNED